MPEPMAARGSERIFGSGEMADRTRAFDWASTAIGPVSQWPDTLLVTVNTLLGSRHPMFLWWGREMIQFYNDAYRPSLREGKHPTALGQGGKECWPEIWHIIGPEIEAVMTRGEASWHENQLVPIFRNGRLDDVYWTYSYSPIRNPDGQICGTLVVCSETTDTVTARRDLEQEHERFADLFAQAPAFFAFLSGPDHVYELINPPYQALIGRRSVVGKSVREAVPEAEEQGFIALLDRVYRTGEPFIGRSTPIELAPGVSEPLEMHYLDFVYQPRRDARGNITGVIVLGVDVTESKRAEQALLQSEKLAAVGRLASSIAHEINNPLEAVTNLVYLAKQAAQNPEAVEFLTMAETELQRASAITSQTLRFHRQATSRRRVIPHELIDSTLSLFHGRLNNSSVSLERRERARRPLFCFDGEIRQVLSNLVGNAIDAMNSGSGRLLVRSREGTHWGSERTGVFFTIADTGCGMSSQTQAKIFEPFFTTKEIGGTGLGLWISREIIERHQGVLKVRSRQAAKGSGTTFILFLPFEE